MKQMVDKMEKLVAWYVYQSEFDIIYVKEHNWIWWNFGMQYLALK